MFSSMEIYRNQRRHFFVIIWAISKDGGNLNLNAPIGVVYTKPTNSPISGVVQPLQLWVIPLSFFPLIVLFSISIAFFSINQSNINVFLFKHPAFASSWSGGGLEGISYFQFYWSNYFFCPSLNFFCLILQ